MPTSISICSNALLMLGAQPINDFEENSDRVRLAANLFPMVCDDMLRKHPWNCASKRVVLAPDVTPPPFDYSYQFSLPADCARVVSVGDYGIEDDYRIEGRKVLANTNVLKLRYIWKNHNPAEWDDALVNIVTLAMAARMAYAITQSASLEQVRIQELELALKRARAVDGQEDPPETFGNFPLYSSRF